MSMLSKFSIIANLRLGIVVICYAKHKSCNGFQPFHKFLALRRIDKCIGEMDTIQIVSNRASEANSDTQQNDGYFFGRISNRERELV